MDKPTKCSYYFSAAWKPVPLTTMGVDDNDDDDYTEMMALVLLYLLLW